MNRNFDKAINALNHCGCKFLISGTGYLLLSKVIHGQSVALEISATDIKGNLWKVSLSYEKLQAHIKKIGLLNSDWNNFFSMMKEALENELVDVELANHKMHLHIDYPIGQAKIRGTFKLILEKHDEQKLIADLVFDYIHKLETKMLKRTREASPEIKSQVVEGLKPKPRFQKKKKPKQIGSKII